MKRFTRMFKNLPKRLVVGAGVALAAVMLPISTLSAATVRLEGSIGIANVTAGDTRYEESVSASYDQVLKIQVYYHNMENPDSNKVANNLNVNLNIPNAPGQRQVITGTISSDDSNTVTDSVVVNLDRSDAYLEYIPGSAVWKHNKGTNDNVQIVEEIVSDNVVYSANGLVLENAKPCFNFDSTLTVLVRVRVPGVKIDKKVRVKGTTEWKTENTAKPGETVEYMLSYQNAGNTVHKNVVIRDNLPPHVTYVPGTTQLKNASGTKSVADGVTTTGINVGNYNPGANAHVLFEAKMPAAAKLACGVTSFRNVGVVRPEGMNEYYNTAETAVEKKCDEKPEVPTYICESLTVEKLGGRKVRATVKAPASGGATFKNVTLNWGDGSAAKVTDQLVNEYTYAQDGTFKVTATATFTVNGVDKTVTSDACAKMVTFEKGVEKCPIPGKEHLPKDSPECKETPVTPELPSTGAGSMISLFAVVTLIGAAVHNVLSRRVA